MDTVSYQNLIPGRSYRAEGTLMVKETGEALSVKGKPVTAEAVFVPEEAAGIVDVTFTFDARSVAGKSVVVFEKLYDTEEGKEVLLTVHEDITDEGQTVKVTEEEAPPEEPAEPPTAPPTETKTEKPPKTGDTQSLLFWLLVMGAGLTGGCYGYLRHRKKQRGHKKETDKKTES